MSFGEIITSYGYLGIVLGTLLEGETTLILGGFFARIGYLDLHWVMLAAFGGTLVSDQFFFFLGRAKGITFLQKRPAWKEKSERVFTLMQSHQAAVMLGFRFFFGLRMVIPVIIGASGLKPLRFFSLNVLTAAIWASIVGSIGYLCGDFLEIIVGEVHKYEIWILAAVVAAGVGLWGRQWLAYRRKRTPNHPH